MALITFKDASFAYEGNVVVSGLNFEINEGEYLCILGENGSGKSTLVKGFLRLKQPVKGSVLANGINNNEIGYMPQQTDIQKNFPASVYEVVLSGRLNKRGFRPFYSKADKLAADKYMEALNIYNIRKSCYMEISGGQQQRVLLTRSLCAMGKMLLLDEPSAGLDPVATQDMYRQIYEINRDANITVVMVSHDINNAVRYASHILHLKNKQLFFGTAKEYIKSDIGVKFLGDGSDA